MDRTARAGSSRARAAVSALLLPVLVLLSLATSTTPAAAAGAPGPSSGAPALRAASLPAGVVTVARSAGSAVARTVARSRSTASPAAQQHDAATAGAVTPGGVPAGGVLAPALAAVPGHVRVPAPPLLPAQRPGPPSAEPRGTDPVPAHGRAPPGPAGT